MAKRNATPSKAQQEVMRRNGINSVLWVVMKEFDHSMIIKHRITGEIRHINK